jgi:hypothetical protein
VSKDDGVIVATGWGPVVVSSVVIALSVFVVVGSPLILTQGVWFAELVGIGVGVWAVWVAGRWHFKATLHPNGRLEFRRLFRITATTVESVRRIELVNDGDGLKANRFVITLAGRRVEIAENRSGRELVDAILELRPKTRIKGFDR